MAISVTPQHPAALCSSVLFQCIKLPQCLPNFWGIRLVALGKLRSLSFVLLCHSVSHLIFHSCSSFLHFPLFCLTSNFSDVYLLFFSSLVFCFSLFHSPWCQTCFSSCSCFASPSPEYLYSVKRHDYRPIWSNKMIFKLEIHFFSLSFLPQCPHESRNITEPILLLGKQGHQEISFFQATATGHKVFCSHCKTKSLPFKPQFQTRVSPAHSGPSQH